MPDCSAIARNSGRIRWITQLDRLRNPKDREGPIFWTGPVLANGRLWIASSRGEVHSVDITTGGSCPFRRPRKPGLVAAGRGERYDLHPRRQRADHCLAVA